MDRKFNSHRQSTCIYGALLSQAEYCAGARDHRSEPCPWLQKRSVPSILSDSLWPHGLQSTRLLCPWDSPGKNTGVGCHVLFQGIFLIDLPDILRIEPASPKFPEMAGVFFTTRASCEAPECLCFSKIHIMTFPSPKVVVLGIWEMIRS